MISKVNCPTFVYLGDEVPRSLTVYAGGMAGRRVQKKHLTDTSASLEVDRKSEYRHYRYLMNR
jgi:hypothetical protein